MVMRIGNENEECGNEMSIPTGVKRIIYPQSSGDEIPISCHKMANHEPNRFKIPIPVNWVH